MVRRPSPTKEELRAVLADLRTRFLSGEIDGATFARQQTAIQQGRMPAEARARRHFGHPFQLVFYALLAWFFIVVQAWQLSLPLVVVVGLLCWLPPDPPSGGRTKPPRIRVGR